MHTGAKTVKGKPSIAAKPPQLRDARLVQRTSTGIARVTTAVDFVRALKQPDIIAAILERPKLEHALTAYRSREGTNATYRALFEVDHVILPQLLENFGVKDVNDKTLPIHQDGLASHWHIHPRELTVIDIWGASGTWILPDILERASPEAMRQRNKENPFALFRYVPDEEVERLQAVPAIAPCGSLVALKGFKITKSAELNIDAGAIHRTPLDANDINLRQERLGRRPERGATAYGRVDNGASFLAASEDRLVTLLEKQYRDMKSIIDSALRRLNRK